MARREWVLRCALMVMVVPALAACSGDSGNHASTHLTQGTPISARRCASPSTFGTTGARAGNEIHGTSRDASLWGLALGPGHVPPQAGDELKVVWRMTGEGPLHVTVRAPNGTARRLTFGPDRHSASSWQRPGDEWGTGFHFTARGCWHIHFARADTSGDVWLDVAT